MPRQKRTPEQKSHDTQTKRKYNERTYDTITIFVDKGDKDKIKAHAASRNMSMNEYIKNAVYDVMRTEDEKRELARSLRDLP